MGEGRRAGVLSKRREGIAPLFSVFLERLRREGGR